MKQINLSDREINLIQNALNAYWNDAVDQLSNGGAIMTESRRELGDIEKSQLEDRRRLVLPLIQRFIKPLDEIETNKGRFYIQNEGYLGNALLWWGRESRGYTSNILEAETYTEVEAKHICQRKEDHAWPCEYIDNLLIAKKTIIDAQHIDKKQEIKWQDG